MYYRVVRVKENKTFLEGMNMAAGDKLAAFKGGCNYNYAGKEAFKRAGMKFLRDTVKVLGWVKDTYDIRYNAGGIAVSGDCRLHADSVYVTFNADDFSGMGILIRTCGGREDYTGGRNQYVSFENLTVERFAEIVARVAAENHTPSYGGTPIRHAVDVTR